MSTFSTSSLLGDGTQQRTIRGDVGRPTGLHTLKLCTSTYMHRDWNSAWKHRYNFDKVEPRTLGSAREELVLIHETVGYLSANLYELSVRTNDIGGSNVLVYTAFTLGLWVYRWWHLVQHKATTLIASMQDLSGAKKVFHQQGCQCCFCQELEREALFFLQSQVMIYLTSLTYINVEDAKLEFSSNRPVAQHVSGRQLFEPGYDAWENEQPFLFAKEDAKQFDKHLQICSICIRKELFYLMAAVETMNLVRHRPMFQSLRAVIRNTYDSAPVGSRNAEFTGKIGNETAKGKLHLSQSAANTSFPEETIAVKRHSEQETIMKARVMTEHYANCLERVAVINETGIDRAKSAQAETLKLFQTEGVITGLILSTAAGSISLVVNTSPSDASHAKLIAATFELFLCSALLSLWASLLYLLSAVRLMHPFSRPYMKSKRLISWWFVYVLHWNTLTRTVLALSFVTLLSGFLAFARVYRMVYLDKLRPTNLNGSAPSLSSIDGSLIGNAMHVFYVPTIVASLALLHLLGRFLWHYVWEYAYGWRVWRRYKAAVEGNDSVEENRFRNSHVFVEALWFFGKENLWPMVGGCLCLKIWMRKKEKDVPEVEA